MLKYRFATAMALALLLSVFTPVTVAEESTDPQSSAEQEEEAGLGGILGGASGVRVANMCTNCNIANVTMSGQSDERVQVWKDGLPVMGGLGTIYLLSIMPEEGIASTEIVNGAGTVLSGSEASAGAVKIRTHKPGKESMIHATLDTGSYGYTGQKVIASGKTGRFGGDLIFTHAKSNGIDVNGDGNLDLGAYDRETYGGTVTVDLGRNSSLRLDALAYREEQRGTKGGYKGDRDVELGEFYEEDIDLRRNEYGLGLDHRFRDGSRLTFRAQMNQGNPVTGDNSPSGGNMTDYMFVDENTELAELRYERFLGSSHLLTGGLVYRNMEFDGLIAKEFSIPQIVQDRIDHQGAYVEAQLSLPHRLALTVGARYDDYDWTPGPDSTSTVPEGYETTRDELLPRAKLAWRATDELSLGLSAGYGLSVPRPVIERVCCGATVVTSARADAETSKNFLLEADYVPWRWWRIKASLFHNEYENFLQKIAISTAPYYIPTFTQINYSDFAFRGVSFSTEFRHFEHLSYGVEFTHLTVDNDEPITIKRYRIPIPLWELPVDEILNHPDDQGSAFIRWDDSAGGLMLSAQAQYTGSMYVQYIQRPVGSWRGTVEETPSFWVFNVSARKRLSRYLSILAGVDNLTNEFQLWLDDPRYEYNWGPLRGRYSYIGLAIEI